MPEEPCYPEVAHVILKFSTKTRVPCPSDKFELYRAVAHVILKFSTKTRVPCPRSLFETIESFIKATNIFWSTGILKTWWLLHVYFLLQNTMKKRVLDI
jgi:hypothetical protein